MNVPSVAFDGPVPFGSRYGLLRPLATGGMAEIDHARQNAMAGIATSETGMSANR